jgi:WD40 repeat protein
VASEGLAWPRLPVADRPPADTEPLVGRSWVLDGLTDWLGQPDGTRLFLVTGDPGTGKSALAAHLVQLSRGRVPSPEEGPSSPGFIDVAHFCRFRVDRTLDALRFVEQLSGELATRYETFRNALTSVNRQEVRISVEQKVDTVAQGGMVTGVVVQIGVRPVREAYDSLVRRPVEALFSERGVRPVVLIDALDEAYTYASDGGLVDLVARIASDPGEDLRIVATCRPDPRILGLLPRPALDLVASEPQGTDDVREYAYRRLRGLVDSERDELAGWIATAASGNFLYAYHILPEVLAHLAEHPVRDVIDRELPEGLEAHYLEFLKRELSRNNERWEDRYRPVLGAIGVARGDGIPRGHIKGVTRLEDSRTDDTLRSCGQYLLGGLPEGPFRLYHRSFREFLVKNSELPVYAAEAERNLGLYLVSRFAGGWARCRDRYALEFTARHLLSSLEEAENGDVPTSLTQALTALMSDVGYLERRVGRLGVTSLLADLATAVRLVPQADRHLLDILEIISQESPALRQWNQEQSPAYLVQQILNRASERQLGFLRDDADRRLRELNVAYLGLNWWAVPASTTDSDGHTGRVWAVAMTRDGRYAVSGAQDCTARVWDLAEGRQKHVLRGHRDAVWAVAFTPDEQRVVSASWDGTLRVWRLASGELEFSLIGHEDGVNAVAVTSDGRRAVSASDDFTVRVWDLRTGRELHILTGHTSEVGAVALTPDGRSAVSIAVRDGSARVWSVQNGSLMHELPGHDVGVTSVAVTPNGRQAVTGGRDHRIVLWDLASGDRLHTLRGHGDEVWWMTVTPDSRQLISGDRAGDVWLWSLTDPERAQQLVGHLFEVDTLAVSSDGRTAVTGSWDRTLRAWDLGSGALRATLSGHLGAVWSVALADNIAVSGGWDYAVRTWDLTTGRERDHFPGRSLSIAALALTPTGDLAAAADSSGDVTVRELATGTIRHTLHTGLSISALTMPNAASVLIGTEQGDVHAIVLATGERRYQLGSGGRPVLDLVVSSAGRATALFADGVRASWDADSGTARSDDEASEQTLDTGALAAETARAVYSAHERRIRLRGTEGSAEIEFPPRHRHWIRSLAITPDGATAVSGGGDRMVRVWDLDQRTERHALSGHEDEVWAVAVSGDGLRAASAGWDRRLSLWDVESGSALAHASFDHAPTCVRLSSDGATIISGDEAGAIRCLQLGGPTGRAQPDQALI